jgi:hypothetical protein
MRAALVIYSLFLVIEAGVAWGISGNPFLAVAVVCGMLFYGAVWKLGGPWGEIVRALTAGLITVAGPLYYKAAIVPTVLCFIALPHILAATQCFWEMALSNDPAQQNVRMRTIVFTIAFYAAMGLIFVLLRGDPALSRGLTTTLAVIVLLAAVPAWDLARVTRLKPGQATQSASFGVLGKRIIWGSVALGMLAALFMGALPVAAEKLCAISPRWKAKIEPPGGLPPRPPQPPPEQHGAEANSTGLDSSALTGRHELPRKSNIQSSGSAQIFVRVKDEAVAKRMAAAGPVYVRSHTFDAWKDGVWESAVSGGRWIADADDGSADGLTTVKKSGQSAVEHTVFLENAVRYSLPALQGVTAFRLPKVYGVPGDLYQIEGPDNRYDAVAAPLNWDQLEDRDELRAGNAGNEAQTRVSPTEAINQLVYGDPILKNLRPDANVPLAEHIASVRKWLSSNVHYSTRVRGNEALTPLDNFLLGERKGFCDFYASAGCLLLRFAKVPTRIAFGYAGNDYDADSNVFIYTDDSAHAWTEIYVDGLGWTICDFTPPGDIGRLNHKVEQRPAFDEKAFEPAEKKEPEPEPKKEPDEFFLTKWWDDLVKQITAMRPVEIIKTVLGWLAVASLLALLVRWLAMKKKKEAAAKDSFAEDARQPAYFAEFLRIFREAGFPRLPGNTAREYYAALFDRGLAGEEFSPMISYHYGCRYTDAEPDREKEASWLSLVRDTEQRLKSLLKNPDGPRRE